MTDKMRTPAGDQWRNRMVRPDGSLSARLNDDVERSFWKSRAGSSAFDDYAKTVYTQVSLLTKGKQIRSVLEIGPGWGNYTFSLCRDFETVTCVDISPDNLLWLTGQAAQMGYQPETICAPWEEAPALKRDLVFAYNCFYRMQEPEWFLQKIDCSAEKLCIIGMNCPPELPWLPKLKDAGLPVAYTSQGCAEMQPVLEALGISAKRMDIPNFRLYRYENTRALLQRAQSFLLTPQDPELLLRLILPDHELQPDGSLVCRYSFLSQLLYWEK